MGRMINPLREIWAGLVSRIMQPQKPPRQRTNLFVGGERRVSVPERLARIAERDARLAADTRTDAQRWLGDPPPNRWALARLLCGVVVR